MGNHIFHEASYTMGGWGRFIIDPMTTTLEGLACWEVCHRDIRCKKWEVIFIKTSWTCLLKSRREQHYKAAQDSLSKGIHQFNHNNWTEGVVLESSFLDVVQ
jgi:hypothetical protein